MNRYGEIADELTDFIEEVASMGRNAQAEALKAALERAFAKACEAERALRVSDAARRGRFKRTGDAWPRSTARLAAS
jgi:hypothetical protein